MCQTWPPPPPTVDPLYYNLWWQLEQAAARLRAGETVRLHGILIRAVMDDENCCKEECSCRQ